MEKLALGALLTMLLALTAAAATRLKSELAVVGDLGGESPAIAYAFDHCRLHYSRISLCDKGQSIPHGFAAK